MCEQSRPHPKPRQTLQPSKTGLQRGERASWPPSRLRAGLRAAPELHLGHTPAVASDFLPRASPVMQGHSGVVCGCRVLWSTLHGEHVSEEGLGVSLCTAHVQQPAQTPSGPGKLTGVLSQMSTHWLFTSASGALSPGPQAGAPSSDAAIPRAESLCCLQGEVVRCGLARGSSRPCTHSKLEPASDEGWHG